jgi:hypothetical protein
LLTVLSPSCAKTGDAEAYRERSLDLASSYQELSFAGSVEIEESDDECLYQISALTIRFLKSYRPFPTSVHLDQFRTVVVAPGAANRAKKDSGYLLERYYPLSASLSSSASEFHTPVIKFTISKRLLRDAEYLSFNVSGQLIRGNDGRYDSLDPLERAKLLEGSHVAWPIPARSNIVSTITDPNGEHGRTIYRRPRDPNDDCSSAKIR